MTVRVAVNGVGRIRRDTLRAVVEPGRTDNFIACDKAALRLKNGPRRVLVSASAYGADKTVVFGVNHGTLTHRDMIVSNGSCTTHCLSQVASVLTEVVGVENVMMTTIHSDTGGGPTQDMMHKDPDRGCGAERLGVRADINVPMADSFTSVSSAGGAFLECREGRTLSGVAALMPNEKV